MSKNQIEPALYIVPTPIGNLEDMTLRAIHVLREADYIACEDTRRTGQLLKLFDIPNKKLLSYHEHNEKSRAVQLSELITANHSVALVSDAGTPGISDPAHRVIKECINQNIKIIPLPGPVALIPALLGSGFPSDGFIFLGFPPHKKGRSTFIKRMMDYELTVIIYESPFRIQKLLEELIIAGFASRRITIARELTKLYEEFIRGTVAECRDILIENKSVKGEFAVVIDRSQN